MLHQVPVQLQDTIGNRDMVVAGAVAGDLGLRAVGMRDLLGYQRPDALLVGNEPLQPVGRFGALDHRHLPEIFQHLRGLLFVQFLLPLVFADLADNGDEAMGKSR